MLAKKNILMPNFHRYNLVFTFLPGRKRVLENCKRKAKASTWQTLTIVVTNQCVKFKPHLPLYYS